MSMQNRELDELLARAASAQRQRLEHVLRPAGLTMAQYRCLCAIERRGTASNAEISRLCDLSPPTVAVVTANLERDGHIERLPHPSNRRIQDIVLTGKGASVIRNAKVRVATAVNSAVGAAIEGIDAEAVGKFLVRLAGALELEQKSLL